jgi:hypothetical protein
MIFSIVCAVSLRIDSNTHAPRPAAHHPFPEDRSEFVKLSSASSAEQRTAGQQRAAGQRRAKEMHVKVESAKESKPLEYR